MRAKNTSVLPGLKVIAWALVLDEDKSDKGKNTSVLPDLKVIAWASVLY